MYSIHIFIFRILAILFDLLSQISQKHRLEPQQHYTHQLSFSWPMWAFMKAWAQLHMGFYAYMVYILLDYV